MVFDERHSVAMPSSYVAYTKLATGDVDAPPPASERRVTVTRRYGSVVLATGCLLSIGLWMWPGFVPSSLPRDHPVDALARPGGRLPPPRPTVIPVAAVASTVDAVPSASTSFDFTPADLALARRHNVTLASWTDPAPEGCLWEWFQRARANSDPKIAVQWADKHAASGCPVYPVPAAGVPFHMLWRGPYHPMLTRAIDAFLATQDLVNYGHRLIFWSVTCERSR